MLSQLPVGAFFAELVDADSLVICEEITWRPFFFWSMVDSVINIESWVRTQTVLVDNY